MKNIKPFKYFNTHAESIIRCDASGVGLGAVLVQNNQSVSYASRKLTDVETRYSQLEREFMALLFTCKRFHGFIIGQKFIIESDNMPILIFFRKKIDSPPLRIQRWMLAIQPYYFSVRHIAGKLNVIADGLSRNPNTCLLYTSPSPRD